MTAGSLALPDQIIDYTYGREHTFFDGIGFNGTDSNLDHVDFSIPYTSALRERLLLAAQSTGIAMTNGGVYGATQGPRLESAAEINRMERDGCTLVGMTGMPEAVLARELGLAYAALCLVVNPAAGRGAGEITMADINRVLATGMVQVQAVLVAALLA
jgi:5'-methylthioinosine phosphorylase